MKYEIRVKNKAARKVWSEVEKGDKVIVARRESQIGLVTVKKFGMPENPFAVLVTDLHSSFSADEAEKIISNSDDGLHIDSDDAKGVIPFSAVKIVPVEEN